MKYVKNSPSNELIKDAIMFGFVLGCTVSLLIAGIIGCTSTIRPKAPVATQASWDGGVQNSGFIGFDAAGNGVLTAHTRDRYNALMDRYGNHFLPPVKAGDGITATATNTFLIDAQHLAYFAHAEWLLKSGQ